MALSYSTLRVVLIPSKFLAITYSLIIIVILGYIGGFGLAYHKGYQAVCPAQSVVVTKVKGTLYTNYPDKDLGVPNPDFYRRIWDAQDIVTPPHGGENGGFFIMTNLIITANQTRDICPESPDIPKAKCQTDKECEIGKSKKNGNGIMTGKCVKVHPTDPSAVKTCQIHAWCPVETRALPLKGTKALLEDTKDFTVLVKNTIEFPEFGPKYVRRNIVEKPPEKATEQYLQSCIYNPKTDPHCPTFRIGDIVERAGFKFSQVALLGGVFAINIKWNCDFDWGRTIDQCLPKYSFSRLDDDKARIAPGWNFRSALFHEENRRTLTQQYGIKVLIEVEGEGRKFDSIKFLLTIGAGLGFLALASLVCDFILDILCKLQNCWNRPWLAKYTPDMKYDQSFLRSYELAKQDPGSSSSPIDMRSPADP